MSVLDCPNGSNSTGSWGPGKENTTTVRFLTEGPGTGLEGCAGIIVQGKRKKRRRKQTQEKDKVLVFSCI